MPIPEIALILFHVVIFEQSNDRGLEIGSRAARLLIMDIPPDGFDLGGQRGVTIRHREMRRRMRAPSLLSMSLISQCDTKTKFATAASNVRLRRLAEALDNSNTQRKLRASSAATWARNLVECVRKKDTAAKEADIEPSRAALAIHRNRFEYTEIDVREEKPIVEQEGHGRDGTRQVPTEPDIHGARPLPRTV